jgi:hypothetical protein
MSHNKRRGLQHGLSDILKPQPSQEEKTRLTNELLAKIAPKEIKTQSSVYQSPVTDSPNNTGDYQSPVTNSLSSPIDQQSPVTDSLTDSKENLSLLTNSLVSNESICDSISTQIRDQESEFVSIGDYQSPVTKSRVDHPSPVTKSHNSAIDSPALVTDSPQYNDPEKNYIKVPNIIFDNLMNLLDPYEYKVYLRLFRLSHGFRKTQCLVGYTALAEACGLSARHVKRVIPELQFKGLIKVLSTYNNADIKGTLYEVLTGDHQTPATTSHARQADTSDNQSSNKHDHEDLKKHDHHQNETMRIYQSITGNNWKKGDQSAYEKIKHISIEAIEQGIRVTIARATARPGSLAYFVKEILAIANPAPAQLGARKKALTAIVARVRELNVGRSFTIGELAEEVKRACARDGAVFDNDLFHEIIG